MEAIKESWSIAVKSKGAVAWAFRKFKSHPSGMSALASDSGKVSLLETKERLNEALASLDQQITLAAMPRTEIRAEDPVITLKKRLG